MICLSLAFISLSLLSSFAYFSFLFHGHCQAFITSLYAVDICAYSIWNRNFFDCEFPDKVDWVRY